MHKVPLPLMINLKFKGTGSMKGKRTCPSNNCK